MSSPQSTPSRRAPPLRTFAVLGALLGLGVGSTAAVAAPILGLVGPGTLVGFDSAAPGTVTSTLTVTGIGSDVLRGIDFRPSNGQLYAVGSAGALYRIDTITGAATAIGPGIPFAGSDLDLGIAFNPVPDAIRVTTATDLNLRVNPNTGTTTTDTQLAFAAGDPNAGTNPTVTGVAYTNQVSGTVTSTTLYGIDASTASLVIQSPPNNGTLTTVGSLGFGLFNFGQGFGIGFDIDGATGQAFASLITTVGQNGFYTVDLSTGTASLIGGFGGNTVRDITVGQIGVVAVPEPASLALFGMGLMGLVAARRRRRAA